MEDIIIYSSGIVAASVCAKNTISIEMITEYLNTESPTDISSKWSLSKDRHFKGGQTNPCSCDKYPETRKHYLFNC